MQKLLRNTLSLCFCLIIALPLAATLCRVGTISNDEFAARELRPRTDFPQRPRQLADLRTWTDGFTAWFNDRYAFRQELINAYGGILYTVFGQSGFPDRVVVGREGFLFLGHTFTNMLRMHSGFPIWTEAGAAAAFSNLQKIRQWLAVRNIPFVCAIAPDKASVYPDYLPAWVRAPNTNLPAVRLKQMAQEQNIPELLYAPELLQQARNKYSDDLYWATDTHWSELGAFIYYQDIMRRLNASGAGPFRVLPETGYTVGEHTPSDLSNFLSYHLPSRDPKFGDSSWPTLPAKHVASGIPVSPDTADAILKNVKHNPQALNPQKIMIIGDSFSDNHLLPLFQRTFASVLAFHNQSASANLQLAIETYQPDVLLLEVVERQCPDMLQTVLADLPEVKKQ